MCLNVIAGEREQTNKRKENGTRTGKRRVYFCFSYAQSVLTEWDNIEHQSGRAEEEAPHMNIIFSEGQRPITHAAAGGV